MNSTFEKNIRTRLIDHQVDAPQHVWTNIEQKKKKKRVIPIFFQSAIALFILGFLAFQFIPKTKLSSLSVNIKPVLAFELHHTIKPQKRIAKPFYKAPIKVQQALTKTVPTKRENSFDNIIVLTINPELTKSKENKNTTLKRDKAQVNPDQLLSDLENQINREQQTRLEKYISKLNKSNASKRINNSIKTANNWVKNKIHLNRNKNK